MEKLVTLLVVGALAIVLIVAFGALLALPVMWLWNALLTGADSILGAPLRPLGFLDAWGLLVLTGLLFKSGGSTSSAK